MLKAQVAVGHGCIPSFVNVRVILSLLVAWPPNSYLLDIPCGLTWQPCPNNRFDTIKTRLQCSPPGTYRGAIDCLLKTVRNEVESHLCADWIMVSNLCSFHSVGFCLIQRSFPSCSRMGRNWFGVTRISSQLSPFIDALWDDGIGTGYRRKTTHCARPRHSRPFCRSHKVLHVWHQGVPERWHDSSAFIATPIELVKG